jgi:hypothetical protein
MAGGANDPDNTPLFKKRIPLRMHASHQALLRDLDGSSWREKLGQLSANPECLAEWNPLPKEISVHAGRSTLCKGTTVKDILTLNPQSIFIDRAFGLSDPSSGRILRYECLHLLDSFVVGLAPQNHWFQIRGIERQIVAIHQ